MSSGSVQYSDRDAEYQLRLSVLDESDNGYLEKAMALEEDLINKKIKLQEKYKNEYESYLSDGVSAESEVCREVKNKWIETEKEIFDAKKSYP